MAVAAERRNRVLGVLAALLAAAVIAVLLVKLQVILVWILVKRGVIPADVWEAVLSRVLIPVALVVAAVVWILVERGVIQVLRWTCLKHLNTPQKPHPTIIHTCVRGRNSGFERKKESRRPPREISRALQKKAWWEGWMETLRGGKDTLRGGKDTLRGGMETLRGGKDTLRGGKDRLRGGMETLRGGMEMLRGGKDTLRGGKETLRGGMETLRGGKDTLRGGKDTLRGGMETLRGGKDRETETVENECENTNLNTDAETGDLQRDESETSV
ncbi:hypothetical protein KUCAC02_036567 [Chaenocephalus aceratus]|nr:hypothetical protein KUCAC02_036567 [Chaenocephalus aceratus]